MGFARPAGVRCAGRTACTAARFGRTLPIDRPLRPFAFWRFADMTATASFSQRLRPILTAACLAMAGAVVSAPASARGPEGIADVAEKVIDAVVNISTSQT